MKKWNKLAVMTVVLCCLLLTGCETLGLSAPTPTQRDSAHVVVNLLEADGDLGAAQADMLRGFIDESADGLSRREILMAGVAALESSAKISKKDAALARAAILMFVKGDDPEAAEAGSSTTDAKP